MIPVEIPRFRARKYLQTRKLSHKMKTGDYAPVAIFLYVSGFIYGIQPLSPRDKSPVPFLISLPISITIRLVE